MNLQSRTLNAPLMASEASVHARLMHRTRVHIRPDPNTLIVLAFMSLLTISTPAVELFNIPRITVVSIPFTIYMLISLGGRVHSKLLRFTLCYIFAFLPSTIIAFLNDEIKLGSFFQGILGLVTMTIVGSYFYNWLSGTSPSIARKQFLRLSYIFIAITLIEQVFYTQFYSLREILYRTDDSVGNAFSLSRELLLYGGRPMSLFSEPSHFARYIGLMMTAFIAVTASAAPSLWAAGAFMLVTRSVSYFFALPALALQTFFAIRTNRRLAGRSGGSPVGTRFAKIAILISAAAGIVTYTQSERIAAALGDGMATRSAISGDGSLNERVLIPIGYLVEGRKSVLIGLGPTPQDEMQSYTVYKTRKVYQWQSLRSDFYSAVSATIFVIVGMGYISILFFAILLFLAMRSFGLLMGSAFLFSNLISSGYNSTTSLVPSGLLLAILLFQRSRNMK